MITAFKNKCFSKKVILSSHPHLGWGVTTVKEVANPVRGMRITVFDVLSYLASGMSFEEILEDFPYLEREDVLACLSYAANKEKIELCA
jgi:hypothetical protein